MIKALLRKKSDTSFSYDESNEDESIGFIEDLGYEATNNICDSDIRNAELVFDYHHADPFEVMRIQTYDDVPMAKRNDEVAIRIEASTVSSLDCRIRDGSFKWKFGQKPSFPIIPGVDCIGTVLSCGLNAEKNGIAPGDRVASFCLHGCNAKYRKLNYLDLIRVPDDICPYEAVVIIRTYTAAFQALMQGIHGHSRYSRKPLFQKRVLIVGPYGTFERALVELSIFLGAKKVYFSEYYSDHSHENCIRQLGAKPLSDDPEEWLEHIEGKINIAVDSVCIDRYEHTLSSLDDDGIMVATGMQDIEKSDDFISNIEKMWTHMTIAINKQCTFYHGFIHEWDINKTQCMKDLIYLFNLLENDKIKPNIATRIPLLKVAAAQDRLDQNLESMERRGVIVVDPWLLSSNE